MKYRAPLELSRGRLTGQVALHPLNLPRLHICADADAVIVGATYGNGSSDPVLLIDVNLTGSVLGELVGRAYWWIQDWRADR